MKTYQRIAQIFNAWEYCQNNGLGLVIPSHEKELNQVVKTAPSGSGIDNGTNFSFDESEENKLVFTFDYHHMNDDGYYIGWSSYKVVVTPSLAFGFELDITNSENEAIIDEADFDYFHEVYHSWLDSEIEI
jgi:hypothetical protein